MEGRILRKTIFIAVLLLMSTKQVIAETTSTKYIFEIDIDGAAESPIHYYLATGSLSGVSNVGWGGATCPNANYVYTLASNSAQKEILSVAISAKVTGKPVSFEGTCSADGNYLQATRIKLR